MVKFFEVVVVEFSSEPPPHSDRGYTFIIDPQPWLWGKGIGIFRV